MLVRRRQEDLRPSAEAQEEAARRIWERQQNSPARVAMARGELFKRARMVLGLDVHMAAAGPLAGVLTARRMRRCESGQIPFPPKAWRVVYDLLTDGSRLVGSDLVEEVKKVLRSVETG